MATKNDEFLQSAIELGELLDATKIPKLKELADQFVRTASVGVRDAEFKGRQLYENYLSKHLGRAKAAPQWGALADKAKETWIRRAIAKGENALAHSNNLR